MKKERKRGEERRTDGDFLGGDADTVVPHLAGEGVLTRKVVGHFHGREERDGGEKVLVKANNIMKTLEVGRQCRLCTLLSLWINRNWRRNGLENKW